MNTFLSGSVELAYHAQGSGFPVICLHGFPDTFETWSETQSALTQAGYFSAAAVLRGYAPSSIPSSQDFSLRTLAADVVALLDHLDLERAAIIGHDWGASIGYALAALHPDRVSSLVTIAIPPLSVFPSGWRETVSRPHNIYLKYTSLGSWWLRHHHFRMVDRLYAKWSPSWSAPNEHIVRVKAALAAPGRARAAVAYYRCPMTRADAVKICVPISVRTLMLYGSDEPEPRQAAFRRASAVTGQGSEIVRLPGVGHWPHLESPREVNQLVVRFLAGDVV